MRNRPCSRPTLAQWTAKAEAGAVAARGNTTTDSANVKFDVAREFVRWKHAVGLSAVYASDERGATGQRWKGRGQSDYKFHQKGFFLDPITKFVVALGAGYKVSRTSMRSPTMRSRSFPAKRQEELIGQFSIDFERLLTATTEIVDQFLVESGANNAFMQNEFSVPVKIMESLALAVAIRRATTPSRPPPSRNWIH